MSLAQLQAAAAYLVRFPEEGRGADWDAFVKRYDLTETEIAQLHHVAHDNQVTKYGKKLRRFRFVDAADALPDPEAILGEELFKRLWFDHFEPVAYGVATENLAHDFLKFLSTDAATKALIAAEAPAHAAEFLEFIYLQTSLAHDPHEWRASTLPEGSLLTHAAVCPLALHYDVPKWLEKDVDDGYRKAKRAPKPFYYVLLLKGDETEPSLFKIDKSVHAFLKAQLTDPAKSPERPEVYQDLVKAGVCKG